MNTTDNALTEAERLLLARVNDCTKPIDAADRNGILKLIDRLAASQSSQLAAAPIDVEAEFEADAKRLALELECWIHANRDSAVTARWWDSSIEALEQHQKLIEEARFGRTPVTPEFAFDVAAYFDALGVPQTASALHAAIEAPYLSQRQGEGS
ncbi:hypothetical protein JFN94_26085 [Burkholderia anthina]|uniref:Uncharacterized protein n=1 Tax=Burkholderia anthina TaxID=179879 RepID=A0A7T7AL99_9BURK|nr:hypothetical protein [Burkholderia anthina]QQK06855.1 hypothetical protein JFN94_26085 [Burkholderia anthina]